ncbi:At2g16790 [Linum grandiflorum]
MSICPLLIQSIPLARLHHFKFILASSSKEEPGAAPDSIHPSIYLNNHAFPSHSTVGQMLATELKCSFLDADDFHPNSNTEKMRQGIPLTDEDRIPWLHLLKDALRQHLVAGNTVVLGCSSLKKSYRDILRLADPHHQHSSSCCCIRFVLLDASVELLTRRLTQRAQQGTHFMPPKLLSSQLELLQVDPDEPILKVDASLPPLQIVSTIVSSFQSSDGLLPSLVTPPLT